MKLPPNIFLALTSETYKEEVNDISAPALPRCKVNNAFRTI